MKPIFSFVQWCLFDNDLRQGGYVFSAIRLTELDEKYHADFDEVRWNGGASAKDKCNKNVGKERGGVEWVTGTKIVVTGPVLRENNKVDNHKMPSIMTGQMSVKSINLKCLFWLWLLSSVSDSIID